MKNMHAPRTFIGAPKTANDIFASLANYQGLQSESKVQAPSADKLQFLRSFKQSSKLSCAPAFRSLTQAKAAKILLAKIIPLLKKNPEMVYDMCTDEIRSCIKNNSIGLEKEILALAADPVDWDAIPQHSPIKWGKCPLLSMCEIDYRGVVRYQVNPDLVKELVSPFSYKKVDLTIHLSFRSNYALKLYEYANQYIEPQRGTGHSPFMSEEKLRQLLGVKPNAYANTAKFAKYAVEEPLIEAKGRGGINILVASDQRTPRMRSYCVEGTEIDHEIAKAFRELYDAKPRRQHWSSLDMLVKRCLMAEYVFIYQMTDEQRAQLRADMCALEKDRPRELLEFRSFTRCYELDMPDEKVTGDILLEPLGIDDSVIAEFESDPAWAPPKEIPIYKYGRLAAED